MATKILDHGANIKESGKVIQNGKVLHDGAFSPLQIAARLASLELATFLVDRGAKFSEA